VFVESRPGNVSWSKAYKALAKKAKMRVEEDGFRGATVSGGLRMTRAKDEDEGAE